MESPVTCSVERAISGDLTLLVGGDAAHATGHQVDDPWQDLDDLMVSLSVVLLETAAVRALPGR